VPLADAVNYEAHAGTFTVEMLLASDPASGVGSGPTVELAPDSVVVVRCRRG